MNCVDLFRHFAREKADRTALWFPPNTNVSFGQLKQSAAGAQVLFQAHGVKAGDGVLLFDRLSPELYAAIIGLLGLGAHVVLVEPWMPLPLIDRAVSLVKPKMFVTNALGWVWGMRSPAIRCIPKWCSWGEIKKQSTLNGLLVELVLPETPGIITFTTGTTGMPKGVMRTQKLLLEQHFVLLEAIRADAYEGADLCVFANLALSNLACGRSTLVMPSLWHPKYFRMLHQLPAELAPVTLTCGPAFLEQLLNHAPLATLKAINIGGALTDCSLFEKGFSLLPEAQWLHIYGSSEAEPVSVCKARHAVSESQSQGYFQTLYVGHPVPQIQSSIEANSLWVSGPHVSPYYLGDEESNRCHKRRDEKGHIWHDMGDRIIASEKGWWYGGRSNLPHDEFILEQKIYAFLQSSKSFVHRSAEGGLYLFGERIHRYRRALLQQFSALTDVYELVVYRDKRHRARIDRQLSLKKGAPWIVG